MSLAVPASHASGEDVQTPVQEEGQHDQSRHDDHAENEEPGAGQEIVIVHLQTIFVMLQAGRLLVSSDTTSHWPLALEYVASLPEFEIVASPCFLGEASQIGPMSNVVALGIPIAVFIALLLVWAAGSLWQALAARCCSEHSARPRNHGSDVRNLLHEDSL